MSRWVLYQEHPAAGRVLDVPEPLERAVAEGRPRPGAFGLVQPNRRLGQGVVERLSG